MGLEMSVVDGTCLDTVQGMTVYILGQCLLTRSCDEVDIQLMFHVDFSVVV